MQRFVIVCVTVLLASAPALADAPGGLVGVYTDLTGGDCSLVEQLFTINSVWVVHRTGPAAQGARLKVAHNWTAIFVQASYPVIYVVDPPDIFAGGFFGYGGCKTPPQWIARLDFLPTIATPPCTVEFHAVADPAAVSGSIEVVDCSGNTVLADPDYSWIVINMDETCTCHVDPVIIDESTWSRIKALYR